MLDRLRQRLSMLASAQKVREVSAQRDRVVCEYLAEYRKLCADVGPWHYAADVGAPPDADIGTIAYLVAWHDMEAPCDFIDEAIDHARLGFEDWLVANPDAAETG